MIVESAEFEIPVALLGNSEEEATRLLAKRTREGKWKEILDYDPIDNRVMWTFENGICTIFFRRPVEPPLDVNEG